MAARTPEVEGRMWDVVVVGSGPAGSAAALAVRRADPAAHVLLLDRSDFPRDKCCGDAVLNRTMTELAEYGVAPSTLLAGYRSVRTLRLVTAGGVSVSGSLPGAMTVLPRVVLDERLLSAARDAGAEWARRTVREVRDHGSHVELDGGIRAKVVIGADGAESAVRRAIERPRARERELAVALRGYDTVVGDTTPTMVFERRGGLSYAWRFPCSDGPANVGYGHLLGRGERANRGELLTTLQRLLPETRPDRASLRAHRLPLATSRQTTACGRVLLAGDAAALINPLSGEGIYYAVTSGLLAGTAAAAGGDGVARRYAADLRRRFGAHHVHAAALATAIRVPGLVEAGLVGAGADPRAFADLSEIGLSDGKVTPRLAATLVRQLVLDRLRPKG